MNLPDQVKIFLTSNRVATVAVIGEHGDYPHAAPVFYIVDKEFTVYFVSASTSQKLKDIAAHPHIAVSITDANGLTTLELKGTAVIVDTIGDKEQFLISEISRVSNASSGTSFAPVMKLDGRGVHLVRIAIDAYHFADYAGHELNVLTGP